MTCNDCIHYEACKDIYYPMSTYDEEAKAFDETNSCDGCPFYSDASRYIELPCKVGDTVYLLDDIVDDEFCKECENYYEGGMGDYPACEKTPYGYRQARCIEIVERVADKDFVLRFFNDFGKTVFLSREEAEKALKERESK